jgi:hypothetical protein
MNAALVDIKISDITQADLAERAAECADRQIADDGPTPEQLPFYLSEGHRVYVEARDTDGMLIDLDDDGDTLDDILDHIRDEIAAAIRAEGGEIHPGMWVASDYVGCGVCPCSPGFFVPGPRLGGKHVWVTVRLRDE